MINPQIYSDTTQLAISLIQKPSITPNDAGCIPLIIERLNQLGFQSEILRFGDVDNLWAKYNTQGPLLVFLGHTDVVPPGSHAAWNSPPFEPVIRDGYLYGRGAVDMKGSIAAMTIAVERFITAYPSFPGSIAFLLTSDEEGPAIDGTRKVVEELIRRHENIKWCLVGEPSSVQSAGDMVRNGRRGSLSADLIIQGVQGHVAYPHLVQNPIHLFIPFLDELVNTAWDRGNEFFPPTQLQVIHIESGTGTYNVTPETLIAKFNFRYSSEVTAELLQQRVTEMLKMHRLAFEIHWIHSAEPFLTTSGQLLEAVQLAIVKVTQNQPRLSTDGGTSDGRFIAPLGTEVVELGLCNRTIHQVNECVSVADLEKLTAIYQAVLENLFLK